MAGLSVSLDTLRRAFAQIAVQPDGCWKWLGATSASGYGVLTDDGLSTSAHRLLFHWLREGVFGDLQIDHLCRNKSCVNPWHMEQVTRSVNMRRALAANKGDYCKRGHLQTAENSRLWKTGGGKTARYCLDCRRIRLGKRVA